VTTGKQSSSSNSHYARFFFPLYYIFGLGDHSGDTSRARQFLPLACLCLDMGMTATGQLRL